MKRKFISLFVCFATLAFANEVKLENSSKQNAWRLTVGPQISIGTKGTLGVKAVAIPVPVNKKTSTRSDAKSSGDRISIGDGRTDLGNGAYIDANDSAGKNGESWNWYVPAGQMNNGKIEIANQYSEHSTEYSTLGDYDTDSSDCVGVNFGIDRMLLKKGRIGLDLGFGFAFLIKDNWFEGKSGYYSKIDTTVDGVYNTSVDFGNADVFEDAWAQNPDGSYGAGSFDGPGPVLNLNEISVSQSWGKEQKKVKTTNYGPFDLNADLEIYEFQLALKPYYEVTEWFMLRGIIGAGLDYRRLDVAVSNVCSDTDSDWSFYMLCGVGGILRWENVCFGVDAIAKVFNEDMDVDTKYVEGSISDADCQLNIFVGYEF